MLIGTVHSCLESIEDCWMLPTYKRALKSDILLIETENLSFLKSLCEYIGEVNLLLSGVSVFVKVPSICISESRYVSFIERMAGLISVLGWELVLPFEVEQIERKSRMSGLSRWYLQKSLCKGCEWYFTNGSFGGGLVDWNLDDSYYSHGSGGRCEYECAYEYFRQYGQAILVRSQDPEKQKRAVSELKKICGRSPCRGRLVGLSGDGK